MSAVNGNDSCISRDIDVVGVTTATVTPRSSSPSISPVAAATTVVDEVTETDPIAAATTTVVVKDEIQVQQGVNNVNVDNIKSDIHHSPTVTGSSIGIGIGTGIGIGAGGGGNVIQTKAVKRKKIADEITLELTHPSVNSFVVEAHATVGSNTGDIYTGDAAAVANTGDAAAVANTGDAAAVANTGTNANTNTGTATAAGAIESKGASFFDATVLTGSRTRRKINGTVTDSNISSDAISPNRRGLGK